MTNAEIAQRTREFSGFARNFANDRDSYRVVKKHGACDTFREAFSEKQLWVVCRFSGRRQRRAGLKYRSAYCAVRCDDLSIWTTTSARADISAAPDSITANANISRASQMPAAVSDRAPSFNFR
jgi:hypothetical protein